MRIHFATTAHALRMAKVLKKLLADAGIKQSLGRCQEHVARMYGYAHWHELAANAKAGSPVSHWDEDVEPAERSNRRLLFVGRLEESLGVSRKLVVSLIDGMKPLGRPSRPDMGELEWRERMKILKPGGWMSLVSGKDEEKIILEYRSGRQVPFAETVHQAGFSFDGTECEALVRRRGNQSEYAVGRIHVVEAVMVRSGGLVGYICGAVVKGSREMHPRDFFYVCDCVGDDEATIAHLVNRQAGGPAALFSQGKTAFLLMDFEMSNKAGKSAGRAFLETVGRILRKTDKGFGALAIKVDPAQFHDVPKASKPSNPSYLSAVDHLSEYFESSAPQRVFGSHARLFLLRPEPMEAGLLGAVGLLGRYAIDENPGYGPSAEMMALFEKVGGFASFEAARQQKMTKTDPSQPKMIEADGFPEGFHSLHAAALKSFKPHPSFWKHMPGDVIGVAVEYSAFPLRWGIERVAPVDRIYFRFVNGSVLELDDEELPGGERFQALPRSLMGAGGMPLLENPFTDRYSTEDLACVLKINSLLLFDGDVASKKPNWPREGIVEIVRP